MAWKHKTVLTLLLGIVAALTASEIWAYDDVRFSKRFKLEEIAKPVAVVATEQRFFVLDEKKDALYVYDAQGRLKKAVGRSGSGKDNFSRPRGMAVAPDGWVFVADTHNSRVQVLDDEGNFVIFWGVSGSDAGELKYPQSVALGPDGRLYVADTGNHRVQVFTRDGIYLFGFGGKGSEAGKFSSPTRIEVDPSGHTYVLDSGNDRIQKFDPKAKFVKQFNLIGSDFTVDAYGFVYMLDPKVGKVREMGPDGTILGAFSSKGTGKGQLNQPVFIQAAPDGSILILDRGQNDLLTVQVANKLKTEPMPENLSANLLISGPSHIWPISATMISAAGDFIYAWLPRQGQFAAIDSDGKVRLNFGKKSGKDPSVTKDCGGLAVSPTHGIFISDPGSDKIQNFDLSGQFVSNFAGSTGFFDSNKKEGRVRGPQGVAVTEKGTVYIADSGNRRVDAFSPDGTFLFSFGPQIGSEELKQPVAVAWDAAGYIYVLDRTLKKVFKCQPSGGLVTAWGGEGEGAGQFMDPVSLAHDGNGYVYVLDRELRRIAVFTKDGSWMTNFLSKGESERVLRDPVAIAVYKDQLVISDPGKDKIVSFKLHPRLEPPPSISSSVVEGEVRLQWKAIENGWTDQYRILRSTASIGPYRMIASTVAVEFKDSQVAAYQTYYYRVATEAKTKDVGPPSPPMAVFVPGAFNRAPIEITSVDIGNIFSANYKYYKENPIGKITLTNNVNVPFQDVKVSFLLKDFMDFGTDTLVHKLDPQEKVELPLKAVLNNRILDVTEDTPIQAQFALTYFESGKPLVISVNKPLRVYARNAITWDKPERIATFITSNDTPIKEFERKVTYQSFSVPAADNLSPPLVAAMKLWNALGAYGLKFQRASNNPFEEVSKDPTFPEDYTQFPRETLRLKTGECDDLSTLIAALLESAGVRTALLDYPGHMALLFDTGSDDSLEIGLPESQIVMHEDTYWIPLEATVIGSSFGQAHRLASNQYREMKKKGQAAVIDPRKAWATFEPATMPTAAWTPEIPKSEEIEKRLESDVTDYAKERHRYLEESLKQMLAKDGNSPEVMTQLALLDVEKGNLDKAAEGFGKILATDAQNASALNNMGSLAFLKKDYAKAESYFLKAAERDPEDSGIWLNLAKCAAKTNDVKKVKEFAAKATAADPKDADLKTAVDNLTRN